MGGEGGNGTSATQAPVPDGRAAELATELEVHKGEPEDASDERDRTERELEPVRHGDAPERCRELCMTGEG